MNTKSFALVVDPYGGTSLTIDGEKVTNARSATLRVHADKPPTLTVEFIDIEVDAKGLAIKISEKQ